MSFLEILVFTVYRFLVMPLVLTFTFFVAGPLSKKVRKGIRLRNPKNGQAHWKCLPRDSKPIWIHCASGEFEYAKPVIRELKKEHPNVKILVTYFSPSYQKNIEKFSEVDGSCALPWDLPGPMISFIKYHNPRALLLARTDLWPEMLLQCRRFKIPSLMFSAPKAKPTKLEILCYPFVRWLFSQLTEIYCASNKDYDQLIKLRAWSESDERGSAKRQTNITVGGDTRYDQVLYRLSKGSSLKEGITGNKGRPVFIVGSSWPKDEEVLSKALKPLVNESKIALIIAPHEVSKKKIKKMKSQSMKKWGAEAVRYSETTYWNQKQILLVDQYGLLAELYKKADIAFIGGSFVRNVHSVMEPLATGCVCFVGPHHHTSPEALKFKEVLIDKKYDLHAVEVVPSARSLNQRVKALLERNDQWSKWKEHIQSEVQKNKGASQKVVDWLRPLI